MSLISFYKNVKQTESADQIHIDLFLDAVRYGKWQDPILNLRTILDKDARRAAKALLPNVTLSGLFGKRIDSDCKLHSTYIGIDLDGLGAEVEAIKNLLSQDPYVFSCFVSAGGEGLCAIFRIVPEKHRQAFEGIADYLLKKYQLIVDPTGINQSRTRFVSYDPHLYISENCATFKKYLPKPKARKIQSAIFVQDEFDRVINEMTAANISCVEDYRDWRDIAFGLSDQFGEGGRGYFHQLSSCSAKYEPSMCDRQYTHALQRTGRGGNKITVATIYWFAKQAGINISSERTRKVASATSTLKKSGLNAKSIAANLEKFEGITGVDDIIQQAFAANTNFESNESLVENVRMWLRHNFDLKRNVITRKVENGGRVLEEVDINTMFLDAKIAFEKLDFILFVKVLFSHNTPEYNPIKDFIESLEWDGTPRIDVLGSCINSSTGDLPWRCKMVRKWYIGIVSAVYGYVSELNLILVGGKYTGKTEFFKRLLPEDLKPYFGVSQLNRGTDDKILMSQKILILNDEYGGKNKMDERNEKMLMASHFFDLRVPYGKGNETVLRLSTLSGTCNGLDVLDDPWGNRRIIVIEAIGKFDYDLYNSLPKDQLIAEGYQLFQAGERPELIDDDIAKLEQYTEGQFSKVSVEGELIHKYFYPHTFAGDDDFYTATEIKLHLENHTKGNLNVNKIGAQLKKMGYERFVKNRIYGYKILKKDELDQTQLRSDDLPF